MPISEFLKPLCHSEALCEIFSNERWAIYRHQHWGWKRGHGYSERPIEGRKFYTLFDWQKNSRHFSN